MALSNKVVSVGTSATEIHNANTGAISGARVYLTNESGQSVFLGDASVTTANGFELPTGNRQVIDIGPGEVLHGISSVASDVSVLVTED